MTHLKRTAQTLLLVCALCITASAGDGIIHGGADKTAVTPPPPPSGSVTESYDGAPATEPSSGESVDLIEIIIEAGSTVLNFTFSLV